MAARSTPDRGRGRGAGRVGLRRREAQRHHQRAGRRARHPGGGPTAPAAAVTFTSPGQGTTTGTRFTAKVELDNFEIDPEAIGKSAVPGKGHLHFGLDGGKFDIPENSGENGKLAKQLGVDGKYSPAAAPTITYAKIPPGRHTLEVYLANNNHTDTGVEEETQFTVK